MRWFLFSALLFAAAVPVYLLRRNRFKKEIGRESLAAEPGQEVPAFLLVTDCIGIILIWFLFVIFAEIFSHFLGPSLKAHKPAIEDMISFSVFFMTLMIVLVASVVRRPPYRGFLTSIGLRKGRSSWFKILVIPFAAGLILALAVAAVETTRHIAPETPLSKALEAAKSPSTLLSFIGMAIIMAPFFEEAIFRGYFFWVVSRFKGRVFAVIFISCVFAFLHVGQYWGDWMAIAVVAVLGLALTLLRDWSGSSIASVVAHYTYNFFVVVTPVVMLIFSNPAYYEYVARYGQLSVSAQEKLLLESIEKKPGFADAYNDLAWLYAQENISLQQALELIKTALISDPRNPAYLDTKAEVLYRLRRFDEAIAIERELVKRYPSDKSFREQLDRFKKRKSGF